MLTRSLTRRRFLEVSAATGAAAACLGTSAAPAFAEGGDIGAAARPESRQTATICPGCPYGCSFTAYEVEGALEKAIGSGADPNAAGTLCVRGYGCAHGAQGSAAVKNPLRRKEDGSFQTISWDEALAEVAERTLAIKDAKGAEALAAIYDGTSPTVAAYVPRFMAALGSGNAFVDDVTLNVNKEAAYVQVIGTGSYVPDFANAGLILLVDTSYADVAVPGLVEQLQAARQAGTPIIAVDSRLGTLASFADEWIGVNPGSELALLLAVCNELISTNRYDEAFVRENTSAFDAWAGAITGCTSRWAEPLTGVESFRIDELASRIAEAAPRLAVEYGNGRVGAAAFSNSSETARCVCLLNTICGVWGAKGGAFLPYDLSSVTLDAAVGPIPGAQSLPTTGLDPLVALGRTVGAFAAHGLQQADAGAINGLFVVGADVAYDYASLDGLDRMLERLDLFVCITDAMTETALLADYVLPAASFLESSSLPVFTSGQVATVAIASPVTSNDEGTARPVAAVISDLADACGLRDAFAFSVDEAAAKQLEAAGVDVAGLKEMGCAEAPALERVSGWPTLTGKIQCISARSLEAGLPESPVWVPTLEEPSIKAVISNDMDLGQQNLSEILTVDGPGSGPTFHLITGQQTVIGPVGYDVPELSSLAGTYDLDSVWINATVADALGISQGDEVMVGNSITSAPARAFVTQRIVPTAVYLPYGFGRASAKQANANGKGVNPLRFSNAIIEGGYGTLCTQEACVWLWKEGE